MTRNLGLLCMTIGVALLLASPALAQAPGGTTEVNAAPFFGPSIAAGLGAGLTIIGAGLGFGKIGAAALESMARQPETAGRVQTAMLIIAALLEGATFLALIVCMLLVFAGPPR
jgi:F-type H+-transporting ATPase subunit c